MNQSVFDLFRDLADSDDDYVAEGGTIMFTHHGNEHVVSLSHVPSIGPALRKRDTEGDWLSVETFIQKEILNLPVLARQIARSLERKHQRQGIKRFIDGPAHVRRSSSEGDEPSAKTALQNLLQIPPLGSTQVIELMAPAGQGKTVLLEHLAIESASAYQPSQSPNPLLLVVDLLGRYVGTIHDAIAGSLSNAYTFPGLTGRDVAFCLRQKWLNLALDGFDELVARVGTREAFLRAKELIDDLRESGTVVLSARDTFFQVFEIDVSIRTYLQPRRGSYTISEFNLKQWEKEQGREVFAILGSRDPDSELGDLLQAFGNDAELVYRPFFTTRLASAWIEGQRFADIGASRGTFDRWDYVIRVFLEREVSEKWRNRQDSSPLLDLEGHITMLGAVAEEMWRSGAFSLTREEVELSGRIGLSDLTLSPTQIDDLVARLPTHGVLSVAAGKSVKFIHESFFIYLLGQRLGSSIIRQDTSSVEAILRSGELRPPVVEWATWRMRKEGASVQGLLGWLLDRDIRKSEHVASINIGLILGHNAKREPVRDLLVQRVDFTGEALLAAKLSGVTFRHCAFWMADLSGSRFDNCEFDNCRFDNVLIHQDTVFGGSRMQQCEFGRIEVGGQAGLFAPSEILAVLQQRGAVIHVMVTGPVEVTRQKRHVSNEAIHCLDKFRRAKTWDISADEMEERLGAVVRTVVKVGMATQVLRQSYPDASGARQTFFRFAVDRERLFSGQLGPTGDRKIDSFWEALEHELPAH